MYTNLVAGGRWAQLRFAPDGTAYATFWIADRAQLKFAKRPPGGSWSISDIPSPSVNEFEHGLDVGPDGVPRVIWILSGGGVYFAEDLGSGFVAQSIGLSSGNQDRAVDIAADTMGRVHVSSTDGVSLWYGVRESGVWSLERVDTGEGVGRYNRIDTAPDGTPYISYFSTPEGALKLAHKSITGWIIETVASVPGWSSRVRQPHQDLHIDSSGAIYLLYWDSISSYVTLASSKVLVALNTPPVSQNDSYSTNEDSPLTIVAPGVLANDSDVDGDTLTAVLVGGPSHGAVTLSSNGSFTYTPGSNYNGSDSFTYKANDGQADSNVATVSLTINPVNDPPIAANDSATTPKNTAVNIAVLTNDSDVDGDTLTVTSVPIQSSQGGTVTTNGTTVTYKPKKGFKGTDNFTYTISDGRGGTASATVTVTVTK